MKENNKLVLDNDTCPRDDIIITVPDVSTITDLRCGMVEDALFVLTILHMRPKNTNHDIIVV